MSRTVLWFRQGGASGIEYTETKGSLTPPGAASGWYPCPIWQGYAYYRVWGAENGLTGPAGAEGAVEHAEDPAHATLALVECMRPSAQDTLAALRRRGFVLVRAQGGGR